MPSPTALALPAPLTVTSTVWQHLCVTLADESLDPIDVLISDHARGSGSVLLRCYSLSWSVYWGNPRKSVANIFAETETDLVVSRISKEGLHPRLKREKTYLRRIVQAAQMAVQVAIENGSIK